MKKLHKLPEKDVTLVKDSPLFDADWYLGRYPDVQMMKMDPLDHFLWIGHRIGRNPSAEFSVSTYLRNYRDVKMAGINPLIHYLKSGVQERRKISPVRDEEEPGERKKSKRIVKDRHLDWDQSRHHETIRRLESLPSPYAADKVSIIMPTYNRAAMISAAIHSVLAQSHHNFELIIVDDGSSDTTADIVNGFDDPRIIFAKNRHGKGVSGARNTGLDLAQGDWAFFLDSDNTWKERMVEYLLKHAAASQSSAGYCAANVHDDAGETKCILYADFDFESCMNGNFIDLNCFFMRWLGPFRSYRFDETLRRLVDWDLILRVAAATRLTGLPYVGVDYYDGKSDRITNKEHIDRGAIADLQNRIRQKSHPLTTDPARIRDASSYRIAVVLHVYHPDRVAECIDYLGNIRVEFDLFVSTSLDPSHEALAQLQLAYPQIRIFFYPNVGADIGPFLELIPTLKTYELVLKIHTKRDVEPWGDAWRRGLFKPVLGSPALVDDILERFRHNEHLAMACSADFYKHGETNSIAPSLEQVELLAKETGLSQHLDQDWAFVAGTVFWVRPQILLKMARMMCDSAGYDTNFVRDGAVEHGLERLVGLALWQDAATRVAVVSLDGTVTEVGLGEGFTREGVSQTMQRLHSA